MSFRFPAALVRPWLPLKPATRPAGLLVLAGLLAFTIVGSLLVGGLSLSPGQVVQAVLNKDATTYEEAAIREVRLPRVVNALVVGIALALAGAGIQGLTRNPLGDPSLFGVSHGAALGMVSVSAFVPQTGIALILAAGFGGGVAAAALVFVIGGAGRGAPQRLALTGFVVASLLGAWVNGILVLNQDTLEKVRFWLAGSLSVRGIEQGPILMSIAGVASIALIFCGRQLTTLSLGEDEARSLGMNTAKVRILIGGLVVIVTATAVCIAGPILFVGLLVPHLMRSLFGPDYRWILWSSFFAGPVFLLGADTVGRVVLAPQELHVGIVSAIAGAPFMIALARRKKVVLV